MDPYLKDAIWGGTKLMEAYGKEWDKPALAESWELSDYPGCESYASDGEYEGLSFYELHKRLAPGKPSVLIKFINGISDRFKIAPCSTIKRNFPFPQYF